MLCLYPSEGGGPFSATLPETSFLVFFDSAGAKRAVEQAKLVERIMTDQFVEDLIILLCDAIVIVVDQLTIDMLKDAVENNPEAKGFIFDGFPRTTKQAMALDDFLNEKSMQISATLALEADDDVLVDRLINRGKTSGRADDQDEEKIINRFEEYNNKTAPLRDFYSAQEKFHSVNGIGSIEEITQRLTLLIDGLL